MFCVQMRKKNQKQHQKDHLRDECVACGCQPWANRQTCDINHLSNSKKKKHNTIKWTVSLRQYEEKNPWIDCAFTHSYSQSNTG